MQFKNFTLWFLMGIFGLFTTNLFAQDATITADEIQYWIGEGENEVVVAISWCSYTETALAWGYRFDGEATVFQALTAIAAEDSRLTVVGSAPTNVTYLDDEYDLTMCTNPEAQWGDPDYDIPMHSVNGLMGQNMMSGEPIQNNDFVKIGGYACGIMSPDWTTISWTTEIIPATNPEGGAVEATIDPADILYWVGEGENEVVYAVNWADPNKCLAWGFRFSEETVTVKKVMEAIAAADGRFEFDASMGFVSNIIYSEGNTPLGVTEGSYFMYNVNGEGAAYGYDEQTVAHGDFIKWGDVACATEIADWTYVWEQTVEPVTVYDALSENMTSTLSVYPNPAAKETFVTLENAGLNEVSVYDVKGRLVSKQSVVATEGDQVRISTETMNAGVYFVRVCHENAVQTAKLVVK